ncbi:hypothetical protein PQ465_15295 [Sphingobacterium oryzagri]|uniref:Uncharacterized protein n=1 Tax=Sphingobacterium oryzagri TaxID=3025669 RepID=A0ABY7WFH9_9SPHI|nr:hypothetical protein [Sphingobacterium sp. KACC 22765]WDF67665.1 hypothetical protein PQ465_15295 [Sphingobacterium sp. KACC 22765]
MLKREDLRAFGEPMLSTMSISGDATADFCFVAIGTDVIGVGIFHDNQPDCTIAVVRDKDGEKSMLGHIAENYPIASTEFMQLLKLYQSNFQPHIS